VALIDKTVVGFALVKRAGGAALLAEVDVLPAHHGRGSEKGLVQKAIQYSQRHDVPLYLTTFADLSWNAPFYYRLGFRALSEDRAPAFMGEIIDEEVKSGFKNRIIMFHKPKGRPV